MRRTLVPLAWLLVGMLALGITGASFADERSSQLDSLQQRLSNARQLVTNIENQAVSVRDQIASIDDQVAAVEKAVSLSTELVDRTRGEIRILQSRIAVTQRAYAKARGLAQDVATELYKSGTAAELEVLLAARSISEISATVEYSSMAMKQKAQIMIASRRLKARLDVDANALQAKLADARILRAEQLAERQHLLELKRAQTEKLARLRQDILESRRETGVLATRSATIKQQLAEAAAAPSPSVAQPASSASTPSTPSAQGSYGFAWPLIGTITSGFGPRWGGFHPGLDIDCVTGDPIHASKAGRVLSASYDSGYGYHVVMDHGGGLGTLYAHASKLYVSAGQSVTQGQTIAACGSTGFSTGDHLHFEIRINGSPRDPLAYLP